MKTYIVHSNFFKTNLKKKDFSIENFKINLRNFTIYITKNIKKLSLQCYNLTIQNFNIDFDKWLIKIINLIPFQ